MEDLVSHRSGDFGLHPVGLQFLAYVSTLLYRQPRSEFGHSVEYARIFLVLVLLEDTHQKILNISSAFVKITADDEQVKVGDQPLNILEEMDQC